MPMLKMDAQKSAGGGGQSIIAVDIASIANDTYNFIIFDGENYWTESVPYGNSRVVTHGNISFQQTATHTFVFTALNGARLYELSNFTDYGVNGSATIGSLYANSYKVYAAVDGTLTQN